MPTRPPRHNARHVALAPERALVHRPAPREPRGKTAERGYDSRWQTARRGYLRRHPLCVHCLAADTLTSATVVDHIQPHRLYEAIRSGDAEQIAESRRKFWDFDGNVQSLCKSCHDRKTAAEDGGFGNKKK